MASSIYRDFSPKFLAKLFENQLRSEIEAEFQKVADEIVKRAAKETASKLEASVESWKSYDRYGEDIRVTLVDKTNA